MAQFEISGLDDLILSLEELAQLPDEVAAEMLTAEGEVIKAAQQQSLQSAGLVDTGQLQASIKLDKKLRKKGDERSMLVYPQGTRRDAKHKHGERNATIGFVHEFGAPKRGIPPSQWMRTANESAADAAVDAAGQVYDKYLKDKGLL